jgi:hypothetical protein
VEHLCWRLLSSCPASTCRSHPSIRQLENLSTTSYTPPSSPKIAPAVNLSADVQIQSCHSQPCILRGPIKLHTTTTTFAIPVPGLVGGSLIYEPGNHTTLLYYCCARYLLGDELMWGVFYVLYKSHDPHSPTHTFLQLGVFSSKGHFYLHYFMFPFF